MEKQAPILGVFYGERVYHQDYLGWVPNLILMLAGVNPSLALRTLASSILCVWILDARKKCGNYYQPNSQMTHLRTLLRALRDIFGWNYNINRDFNFVGGLTAIFNKMVMDCYKEIGGKSASRVPIHLANHYSGSFCRQLRRDQEGRARRSQVDEAT